MPRSPRSETPTCGEAGSLARACGHFADYVRRRVARDGLRRALVFRAAAYEAVAREALRALTAAGLEAELRSAADLAAIESFYDRDFLVIFNDPQDELAGIIRSKPAFLLKNWCNSFKLTGMRGHFPEVFRHPPEVIAAFTARVRESLDRQPGIRYDAPGGTALEIDLSPGKPMTVIDGLQGEDMVPAEAAAFTERIDGEVVFEGTFLCVVPFAAKYGVIRPGELRLGLRSGRVTELGGSNQELVADLRRHFARCPDNACVDEVGFGTNLGVTELYATNSVFEERHVGLHLGLGGKEEGSTHLDLLFAGGDIACGEITLYRAGAWVPELTAGLV